MLNPSLLSTWIPYIPTLLYQWTTQRWIDYDFPRHIHIELTTRCNLSCKTCPRPKVDQDMDFELFRSIIDEAGLYGPRSFSLHLFGEPLLYEKIEEAVSYIKTKNPRNVVVLTTNGTYLNDFSSSLEVDRIIWTWRPNNFNDATLGVLKRIGTIRFLIETTPLDEIGKWRGFKREIKHVHNFGGSMYTGYQDISRYACYHLWLSPSITWDGKILLCCNDPYRRISVSQFRKIGDIRDAWRSFSLHDQRTMQLTGNFRGVCKNCDAWKTYPAIF